MKYFSLLFLLIVGHSSFVQDNYILHQKKYFDRELKKWTESFNYFNLSEFTVEDTLQFENNFEQDLSSLDMFLSIYKPIITYSPDSSKFIDVYSYQLGLEKKDTYYQANIEIDQAVLLCHPKEKYWNRIYFGTNMIWIDEVIWISTTKFILVGIVKSLDFRKQPLILVGDTETQSLIKYLCTNSSTVQVDKGYSSEKLKRLRIESL